MSRSKLILCALSQLFAEGDLQQWFEQAARLSLPLHLNDVIQSLEGRALLQQSHCIDEELKQYPDKILNWLFQQPMTQIREAGCLALIGLCIEQAIEHQQLTLNNLVLRCDSSNLTNASLMLVHWWPARLQHALLKSTAIKGEHSYIDTFLGAMASDELNVAIVCLFNQQVDKGSYWLGQQQLSAKLTQKELRYWWQNLPIEAPSSM